MTVDETRRIELYEQLSVLVGAEATRTLFELLPPAGRDVATSDDIDHLARDLRAEMTQLRSDLRGEMTELRGDLRGEMAELRGDLRGEMTELRGEMTELRGGMAELRGEMTGSRGEFRGELQAMTERIEGLRHELLGALHHEISRALVVQTRTTVFAMVTALAAIAALALGLG
jgi:predicted nuclease with TOPRIM domain